MTTLFCLLLSALIFLAAPWLMQIFISSDEKEIIRIGVEYLRVEGSFYLGIGYLFLWYGFYRAVCKPEMSIILTILSLGTRVALAYLWHPFLPSVYTVSGGPFLSAGHWRISTDKCITGKRSVPYLSLPPFHNKRHTLHLIPSHQSKKQEPSTHIQSSSILQLLHFPILLLLQRNLFSSLHIQRRKARSAVHTSQPAFS